MNGRQWRWSGSRWLIIVFKSTDGEIHCVVMEGGREAIERRCRRIELEARYV